MNGKRSVTANSINGCTDSTNISNMFADKFQQLYNCVSYDSREMGDIRSAIKNRIAADGYTVDYTVSANEVSSAITRLKFNKNDGGAGLSTNHFKHALPCTPFATHTERLFVILLTHGSVIDDLLYLYRKAATST